jgi:hypothetical protein
MEIAANRTEPLSPLRSVSQTRARIAAYHI